jgi:hypothetical protein
MKRRTTEQVIKDEMKNGKIKIAYGMQNFRSGKSPLTIEEGLKRLTPEM